MSKSSNLVSKIKMTSYDDLFGTSDHPENDVKDISLDELHEFRGHPFKVLDDEKMEETVQSIKEHGVIVPGIARRRKEGGYELIAGHRRKRASELAGLITMPVRVMELSDDEAVQLMVDTNIQRETMLPSERARAYAMRYEAAKHQGKNVAGGKDSLEELSDALGESAKTIQRYIWLSRLSDPLLELVDQKKLGLTQGMDLSFLNEEQQQLVYEEICQNNRNVSTAQSAKLKMYGKSNELTPAMVDLILSEEKVKEKKIVIKEAVINRYFPEHYTQQQITEVIANLLEQWKREEHMGSRGDCE